MSEFKVNTKSLRDISSCVGAYGTDLEKLSDNILGIQQNLAFSTTQTDAIIRKFNQIESKILEEAVRMSNLSKALEYIAEMYVKYEDRCIGNADGTKGILARIYENLEYFGKKLLEWLDLDDDYYRGKIGYKDFDAEKIQEKLMDQYLQRAVGNLLNKEEYSEEAWNKASLEERKKILESLFYEINLIMGTDVNIVKFERMEPNTKRGYYSDSQRIVAINENYLQLDNASSYLIMRTMIHEMRHAYQHAAINNPDNFLVSEETRQEWADSFLKYKNASQIGYEKYVTQSVEYDAKSFAEQYQDIEGYTPNYGGSWV